MFQRQCFVASLMISGALRLLSNMPVVDHGNVAELSFTTKVLNLDNCIRI